SSSTSTTHGGSRDEFYRYHGATASDGAVPERPMSPAIDAGRSHSPKPLHPSPLATGTAPSPAAAAAAATTATGAPAGNAYDESFVGEGSEAAAANATFSIGDSAAGGVDDDGTPTTSSSTSTSATTSTTSTPKAKAMVDELTAALMVCRSLNA